MCGIYKATGKRESQVSVMSAIGISSGMSSLYILSQPTEATSHEPLPRFPLCSLTWTTEYERTVQFSHNLHLTVFLLDCRWLFSDA